MYCVAIQTAAAEWTKIGVTETGFHYISGALLTKWGFVSPEEVRIFGYGCESADDFPQIETMVVDGGILFYASGPVKSYLDSDLTPTIVTHPYTSKGYYFLTADNSQSKDFGVEQPSLSSKEKAETYAVAWHQSELFSPGATGQLLVGEDFSRQSNQAFSIATPGAVHECEAIVLTRFMAKSVGGISTLKINSNSFSIPQINDIRYDFGNMISPTVKTIINNNIATINLSITSSGQLRAANLDYIAVAYPCDLSGDNQIFFSKGGKINKSNHLIFDITDPQKIVRITSDELCQSTMPRCYQMINNIKKLPAPVYESVVNNQDFHSDFSLPQMIIITPDKWKSQATRLAKLHSNEDIPTIVLSAEQIYNEFSSGRFDPSGIKKCLKMYYDRGINSGQPLKYALLFGRGVYDNRQLTTQCKRIDYPMLPTWQSEESLNDISSFMTDDYFAILDDEALKDTLSIAVGRLCITSTDEAERVVDKISNYINNPAPGQWKNKVLMLADDGDSGCHLQYAENMIDKMKQSGGQDIMFSKLYLDSFKKTNGSYPEASRRLETELNNGVGWWTFIGHAGQTSLTADKLLTYNDIINLNRTIPPAMLAFTCNFLRCDNHDISGGELLLNNRHGGVIAAVSATRPVNMHQSGDLASAFGSLICNKELTVGEIYRRAKNQYRSQNQNGTELRYILLGDPALKIAAINKKIIVKSINDIELSDLNQPTVGAMSRMTVDGYISDKYGTTESNFNGNITMQIYDAETSITTNGNSWDGVKSVYDTEGQLLYAGTDTVINGIFKTTAIIPAEISDNYRNATLRLYAVDSRSGDEASGKESRFYIYGKGDGVTDTIKPVIESFYLNRPSFKSGDIVNSSPTIYITVTDNSSIDISTTSIANRMLLKLDNTPLPDLSLYYSPIVSTNAGGRIVYPLQSLDDGLHTLTFEVSDIAGNRVEQTIEFVTQTNLNPEILKIYTTTQPAVDKAIFYIEHNRPNEIINVTLHVFDIRGNMIWESTRQGRGETFNSEPFSWNLIDRSNRRVTRGIYIYRFTIKDINGATSVSRANKLAISN